MAKAQAMFSKATEQAKGDLVRLQASWGTIQIVMHAKLGDERWSEVTANVAFEGEGHANDGRLRQAYYAKLYRF